MKTIISIGILLIIFLIPACSNGQEEPVKPAQDSVSEVTETPLEEPVEPVEPIKQEEGKSWDFSTTIILVLLLSNFLSISIAYYLYQWRQKTEGGNKLIVLPDEVFSAIDSNKQAINKLSDTQNASLDSLLSGLAESAEKGASQFKDIQEYLASIRKIAEEKGEELARYQEGYDFVKYKVFIKSLVRMLENLNEDIDKLNSAEDKSPARDKAIDALECAYDDLEVLLENNGVESFKPENGQAADTADLSYRVVNRIEPEKPEQSMTIAKVVKQGFSLELMDGERKILVPADVEIYKKYETKESEDE